MRCWYCGKDTMKPVAELGLCWHKCSNCSATHLVNPTTFLSGGLGIEHNEATGGTKGKPMPFRAAAKRQPIRLPKSPIKI